jgi:hypothetical protein|tara:strand:- start:7182 stop:7427 length:246 start_codon:yes stop_codon:yes gene_type:complete
MQWIKTDGTIEEVAIDKDNSLKQMQDAVGGYIELVRLTDDDVMIVNEEGLIFGLPVNEHASKLAGQSIVGNVLICKRKDLD